MTVTPPSYGQDGTGQRVPIHGNSDDRSLSELLSKATEDLQHLIQREVELAKMEIQAQVNKVTKGVAMLGAAAVVGLLAAILLSLAAGWGLAEVMATWLAFLVVGVIYLIVVAVLALRAKKELTSVRPPQQTMATLKEDIQVAKQSISSGLSGDDSGAEYSRPWDTAAQWAPRTGMQES